MGFFGSSKGSSDRPDAATARAPRWSSLRGSHSAVVGGQPIAHGLSRREARQVADEAVRNGTDRQEWFHWYTARRPAQADAPAGPRTGRGIARWYAPA